ncbi:MAG: hypothetical protein ACE5DI_00935 [Candidatus Micrarchaeia archaeon]
MTSTDGQDLKHAYIEGRLLGLSQLISILKEAVGSEEEEGSPLLVKSIVGHISSEMDSIIVDLKERHGGLPVLEQAQEKSKQIASGAARINSSKEAKKHVEAADDLMKNLLEMKEGQDVKASGKNGSE